MTIINNNNLFAAISEKIDGDMKGYYDCNAQANRQAFLNKFPSTKEKPLYYAKVDHGNKCVVVDGKKSPRIISADGLITDQKEIFLSVTAADCPPLYLYDPKKQIVGIAHCGWKNLDKKGIVYNMINEFNNLGSRRKDILAWIGPGIHIDHYDVGKEVLDYLDMEINLKEQVFGKIKISLQNIIFYRLRNEGVFSSNINLASDECVFCADPCNEADMNKKMIFTISNGTYEFPFPKKYFSRRREGQNHGAMLAVIGLKK